MSTAAASSSPGMLSLPVGTTYCLANAPPLWFWVSTRSEACGSEEAYCVARQSLLEVDILNTRGHPVVKPS